MSFTYDEANLGSTLNRLRLEIGDTDSDRQLLQDQEINNIISNYSTLYKRAAKCCKLICAKYAGKNDYKIGSDSEKVSQIYTHYLAMAKDFASKSFGEPWAGGVYTSDKDAIIDDTSLETPSIKRGLHDNT